MHVIIDTTAVYRDKLFEGTRVRTVASAARALGGGLWVPEIVLDELLGQVRKEIKRSNADVASALDALKGYVSPHLMPTKPEVDLEESVEAYVQKRDETIDRLAIGIVHYPKLTPRDLVRRYYDGLRPYKADGTGFKDHMVWRSFVEFVAQRQGDCDHQFILVTNNSKDFGDGKGGFHEDLKRDAQSFGVDLARIVLSDQLHAVVRDYVTPREEAIKDAKKRLMDATEAFLRERGEAVISQAIKSRYLDIGLPPGITNLGIDSLKVDVFSKPTLTPIVEETLAECEVQYRCEFHGVAPLSDWDWIGAQLDVLSDDVDEEAHYVSFNARMDGVATVRFTLNDSLEITSYEATETG